MGTSRNRVSDPYCLSMSPLLQKFNSDTISILASLLRCCPVMDELEERLCGYEQFCQKEGPVFCCCFLDSLLYRTLSTLYNRQWLYATFQVIVGEQFIYVGHPIKNETFSPAH